MSNQAPTNKPSPTDQILDLLLDALIERQKVRREQARTGVVPLAAPTGETSITAEQPAIQDEASAPPSVPPPRPEPPASEQRRPARPA